MRWHARFGAHEPVELDSERENAHRARAGCAPSIHGTWKNTTPTKSQRLRIMRLIRKLPCVTKCAGSCLHLALSQCCADTACIDSSRAKEEQMSRGGAARAAATAATCTAGARRASSLAQSTRGRSSPTPSSVFGTLMVANLANLIKEYSTLPCAGGVPRLRGAAGGPGGGRCSTLPAA